MLRKVFYLSYVLKFDPRFLGFGLFDNLCGDYCGGFSMHCLICSCIPGSQSLGVSSQYSSLTQRWEPNIPPDIPKWPCEGKIALVWEPLVYTIPLIFSNIKPRVNTVAWMFIYFIYIRAPNLCGQMPDDLRWSWCNINRNKVHNKCNTLGSSWPTHHPVRGKIVFQETSPWCQKCWRPLLYSIQSTLHSFISIKITTRECEETSWKKVKCFVHITREATRPKPFHSGFINVPKCLLLTSYVTALFQLWRI